VGGLESYIEDHIANQSMLVVCKIGCHLGTLTVQVYAWAGGRAEGQARFDLLSVEAIIRINQHLSAT
jgi:hypothetical protein